MIAVSYTELLKRFVFNAFLLDDSLERLEKEGISIRSGATVIPVERIEEADFSPRIIHDANKMSSIYVAFFCLENAVRELITDRLVERHGIDWWDTCVPVKIKTAVEKLKQKDEQNKYRSSRTTSEIGYTTFGNLGQIIINKWEDFSDLFPNQSWITSRFNDLEMSRNTIMHSGILPEIEIERIESIVRDWVRQVG